MASIFRDRYNNLNPIVVIVGIVFVVIMGLIILLSCITGVPAGSVAVQNTWGSVDNNLLDPGLHLKGPFTDIIPMSTRTQNYIDYGAADKATITALSHDGMSTSMDIAVTFHLNPAHVVALYNNVGENYMNIVMVNPIHAVPRDLISKYDTKTLYSASKEGSTDRAALEQELFTGISQRMNDIGVRDSIIIDQVSIRNIDFPQSYKDMINAKMNTDTAIATKLLEVQVADAEAKKAVATSQGLADAQRIAAQGDADSTRIRNSEAPSEAVLMQMFIQAMKENPKAIYIPIGPNGLPLFKAVENTS